MDKYHAPHVNQFHDSTGRPWGTVYDKANCGFATGARGIDHATRGRRQPSPPEVRAASGMKQMTGRIINMVEAAQNLGVDSPTAYWGLPWSRVRNLLANPRVAIQLQTDYEYVPDSLSCQPDFDEGHSFLVFGGTLRTEPGEKGKPSFTTVRAGDPLCEGDKRYPLSILRRAATEYGEANGHPDDTVVCAIWWAPAEPDPDPEPGPTLQERYDALVRKHALLVEEHTATTEELDGALTVLAQVSVLTARFVP